MKAWRVVVVRAAFLLVGSLVVPSPVRAAPPLGYVPPIDVVGEAMRNGATPWQDAQKNAQQLGKGLKGMGTTMKGLNALTKAAGFASTWEDFEKFEALTDADTEAIAEAQVGEGGPAIPSKCRASVDCTACMEPAFDKLNQLRRDYVKLRLLYKKTRKLRDDAIAMGDAIAALPHAGLGWGRAKISINKSFAEFEANYTQQHKKGIDYLEKLLREIGACEREHLDGEGWYDTFGFLYVAFMRDRYDLGR